MGGIISPSKEEEILKLIRQDNDKKLQEFLTDNQLGSDILYTKHKRTLIQLCCYYESPKCLSKLIEMDYDYNQVESSNGNTPLFIACKFNGLDLVKILLSKDDCKTLIKNNENLNEFDIAFLKGNYQICYYLLYEYKNKVNDRSNGKDNNQDNNHNNNVDHIDNDNININTDTNININNNMNENNYNYDMNQIYQKYFYNNNFDIDTFLSLQETNQYPLFNMQLFFKSLCKKIPPNKCESFAPERKKTKDLLTKIPDPNETWGHFFKRMVNLELYNPPLVDKKNVSQMNSMYMNTQMKLIENEYGIKLGYYNPNTDPNNNDNNLNEEEEPIIKIKKKRDIIQKDDENEEEKEEDDDNNEDNIENGKGNNDDKSENISVLKVQDYSSKRKMNIKNNGD